MNTLPEHDHVPAPETNRVKTAPFQDSREHLSAELARIDLLIQCEIWRWRQKGAPAGDEFRGLYISEDEIDAILNGIYVGSPELQRRAGEGATAVERAFGQAIARAEEQIQSRIRAQGAPLRLQQLGQLFALTRFDVDALLVALAPEIDLRYERLYAYLQDDVTCKRPSVALILNLCAAPEERLAARRRFAADAPLLRHMLLALDHDPAQPHPPMLAHFAWPDPRIVDFLLGEGPHCALDPRLREVHEGSDRGVRIADLVLPAATQAQLAWLATQAPLGTQAPPSPALFLLSGDPGTDQREAAQALCAAWGRRL
jgi:hypothetical protein